MRRYRATLAYDGTRYQGFQRLTDERPSIQAEVETALRAVTGENIITIGAGRTDTGVHAIGQVIAFDSDWRHSNEALLNAVNLHLPPDIALQNVRQQEGFHPRFDALSRIYRYAVIEAKARQPLLVNRAWQRWGPLNVEAMQAAAALLVGTHDFATFGHPPKGENTVREVFRSEWQVFAAQFGRVHLYRIEATAYLHHMVRRVVGMMVKVGENRLTVAEFAEAFYSADIAKARVIAPPHGLVLEAVRYPNDEIVEVPLTSALLIL